MLLSRTQSRRVFKGLLVTVFSIFLLLLLAKPSHDRHSIPNNQQPLSQHLSHEIKSEDIVPFGLDDISHDSTTFAVGSRSKLTKRAIDYDTLVCKGDIALGMLRNGPPSPRQWTQRDLDVAWDVEDQDWDPNEAIFGELKALGIKPEHDPDVTFYLEADQHRYFTGADGREKPPTQGQYYNTYIPDNGTIIAQNNHAPRYKSPGMEEPVLNRWSDIAWLLWSQKAGNRAGGLRNIVQEVITTPLTRALIEYIEVAEPDNLDLPYPGTIYDMRTNDTKALLASPHGIGVAFMLKDHRNILGPRWPAVRIFTARNASPFSKEKFNYFMVWYLRQTITGPN